MIDGMIILSKKNPLKLPLRVGIDVIKLATLLSEEN